MSSVIASRRYASALLSAAEEGQFLDEAADALNTIKEHSITPVIWLMPSEAH